MTRLDKNGRLALAARYADGEATLHDLRAAGHDRMIELLADLADLGRRPPTAALVGPNVALRKAGMARLARALRP